jgi:hypothetical protein
MLIAWQLAPLVLPSRQACPLCGRQGARPPRPRLKAAETAGAAANCGPPGQCASPI